MLGSAVLVVGAEITQTHELIAHGSLCIAQRCFHFTAGEHFQRVGIQAAEEILAGGIGISIVEQVIILAYLCIHSGGSVHPVDGRAFDFAAIGRIATLGVGVLLYP